VYVAELARSGCRAGSLALTRHGDPCRVTSNTPAPVTAGSPTELIHYWYPTVTPINTLIRDQIKVQLLGH